MSAHYVGKSSSPGSRLASGENQGAVQEWLEKNGIRILNVAGPRENEAPGIHDRAMEFLRGVVNP